MCPVSCMSDYLRCRLNSSTRPSEPLFLCLNQLPLTRDFFLNHLRVALHAAGQDDKCFSGHSFRIGAATSAASGQVEDHLIKALRRWNSDSYSRYIRGTVKELQWAQLAMYNYYNRWILEVTCWSGCWYHLVYSIIFDIRLFAYILYVICVTCYDVY